MTTAVPRHRFQPVAVRACECALACPDVGADAPGIRLSAEYSAWRPLWAKATPPPTRCSGVHSSPERSICSCCRRPKSVRIAASEWPADGNESRMSPDPHVCRRRRPALLEGGAASTRKAADRPSRERPPKPFGHAGPAGSARSSARRKDPWTGLGVSSRYAMHSAAGWPSGDGRACRRPGRGGSRWRAGERVPRPDPLRSAKAAIAWGGDSPSRHA